MRRLSWAFAAILLVGCSGGGGSGEAASEPETVEYKLAVVDAGGYVSPDDPVVDRFAAALDVLQDRCWKNSRARIGDMLVSIQQQLQEEGVFKNLLTIVTAVANPVTFSALQDEVDAFPPGAIPESSREGDCGAYFTAYILLETGG